MLGGHLRAGMRGSCAPLLSTNPMFQQELSRHSEAEGPTDDTQMRQAGLASLPAVPQAPRSHSAASSRAGTRTALPAVHPPAFGRGTPLSQSDGHSSGQMQESAANTTQPQQLPSLPAAVGQREQPGSPAAGTVQLGTPRQQCGLHRLASSSRLGSAKSSGSSTSTSRQSLRQHFPRRAAWEYSLRRAATPALAHVAEASEEAAAAAAGGQDGQPHEQARDDEPQLATLPAEGLSPQTLLQHATAVAVAERSACHSCSQDPALHPPSSLSPAMLRLHNNAAFRCSQTSSRRGTECSDAGLPALQLRHVRAPLLSTASSRHELDMQTLVDELMGPPAAFQQQQQQPEAERELAAARAELAAARQLAAQQAQQLAREARELEELHGSLAAVRRQVAEVQARQRTAGARVALAQRQVAAQQAAGTARLAHMHCEAAAACEAAEAALRQERKQLVGALEEEAAAAAQLAQAEAVADCWRQRHNKMLCQHRPAPRAEKGATWWEAKAPFFQNIESAAAGMPYCSSRIDKQQLRQQR